MCSILHGDDVATTKLGGIHASEQLTGGVLTHQTFVAMVEAAVADTSVTGEQETTAEIKVQNVRTSKFKLHSKKVRSSHTIRMKSALIRRRLVPNSYRTLPYGFLENAKPEHMHTNPFTQ